MTQIRWNGEEQNLKPSEFGHTGNAHHVIYDDEVWSTTVEQEFDTADNQFPYLVKWLSALSAKEDQASEAIEKRLYAEILPEDRRRQLAECMASLIVRSPRSRYRIKKSIETAVGADYKATKSLIAENLQGQQRTFSNAIERGGKYVILISNKREFIFGDGFLHNFPTATGFPFSGTFIIPILPTVTVAFTQPHAYRPLPRLLTVAPSEDEVTFFNEIVQAYSCDQIFYRKDRPKLTEEFSKRQHLQFRYNSHWWLDRLFDAACQKA